MLKAANDRIGGKGHGFVMGAKALSGGGGGVWYNYDGDFEGVTAVYGFGGGANAFAYNRTATEVSYIAPHANYPDNTATPRPKPKKQKAVLNMGIIGLGTWSAMGFKPPNQYYFTGGHSDFKFAKEALQLLCEGQCELLLDTQYKCIAAAMSKDGEAQAEGDHDRESAEAFTVVQCNRWTKGKQCTFEVSACR